MANQKENTANNIGSFIKKSRKNAGLTQEEFAMRSGLGLRFVRELEQGKTTVRLDKVNQALYMFGCKAGVVRVENTDELFDGNDNTSNADTSGDSNA